MLEGRVFLGFLIMFIRLCSSILMFIRDIYSSVVYHNFDAMLFILILWMQL